jgi:hypothetical protein
LLLSQPDNGLGSPDNFDGNFNLIAVANGVEDQVVLDLEVCDCADANRTVIRSFD